MTTLLLAQGRASGHRALRPFLSCPSRTQLESSTRPSYHALQYAHFRPRFAQCFASAAPAAVTSNGGYRSPPEQILKIVDAPPEPLYSFSPCRKMVLQLARPPSNPPVAEFARPELKLAGIRIDPEGYCRSRMSYYTGISVAPFTDDLSLPFAQNSSSSSKPIVGIPEGYGINDVCWSRDSTKIAFTIRRAGDDWEAARPPAQLWIADMVSGQARCLLEQSLNSIFEDYTWLDADTVIASVIPGGHSVPPPTKPATPLGPRIEENVVKGNATMSRTYQDLLKDSHDIALFEHYCTSQLMKVTISSGETVLLSDESRVYTAVSPSPDGRYICAAWFEPPWSFAVPCGRFPKRVQLWDTEGAFIKEIANLPLAENIPLAFDSCREGPRGISWRDDKPAELVWTECQDGGDPAIEVSPRDIVYALSADDAAGEQDCTPRQIAATDMRFSDITWGHGELALMYEGEWKTRRSKTWIIAPDATADNNAPPPELLFDRNYEDSYTDPGSPLLRRTALGQYVLAEIDGPRKLMMQGAGASSDGSKPFLDLLDLDTRETKRVWQSSPPYYEFISSILSDVEDGPIKLETLKMLGRRESVEDPPQYYIVNFTSDAKGEEKKEIGATWRQISQFPHPYPSLVGLQKETLRYKRSDGCELNGTLYLPPGYDKERDGPLPCILWAYPREFKSKDAAGQLRKSPHTFDSVGSTSPLLFLTLGYAVLDGPSMPIIGEGEEEPNDSYVEQLTASAAAAVEELGRQGTVAVDKIAVGGHR